MKNRLFFLLWIVIGGSIPSLFAQTPSCSLTLSGKVVDASTGEALPQATLFFRGATSTSTQSNASGQFSIGHLCAGNYTVEISHVDCAPVKILVQLAKSDETLLIRLPHRFNELEEVQVVGQRSASTLIIREELRGKRIEETRGLSLGEALRQVNGVQVLQTGSTIFKPVIHGLHSQRVLMLNNGVRLEGQQWGSEHAPEIDPFTADRFTVLKGAGALRYGSDAIAGAILAEPAPMPNDGRLSGRAHLGYFTNNRQDVAHLTLQQQLAKLPAWSWRVQGTYKRGGNTKTPRYWLYNSGLEEADLAVTLAYRKARYRSEWYASLVNTTLGLFTGAHIGNLTDLQTAIQADKPVQNIDRFSYTIDRPRQEVRHMLLKWKQTFLLPNHQRIVTTLSHQENIRKEFDRALLTNRPELDLSIGTTMLDASWEQVHTDPTATTAGISITRQENVWSGSRFFIPNFVSWNVAAYAMERYAKGRWSLEGGLRYDQRFQEVFRNNNGAITSSKQRFGNLSTLGAAQYRWNTNWQLSANMALAWRAPQINELFVNGLHHGTSNFEIGDPNLRSERAWNNNIQVQYQSDSTWTFDLTVYHNRIYDFINLIPVLPPTLTIRGAYPTFRFIQTDAALTGVDLQATRWIGPRFQAGMKGSFLFARDRRLGDWLQQMPAHRVEAEWSWYWGKQVDAQTRYLRLSVPYVFEQTQVPTSLQDYLPPPPAYALVNLNFATPLQIWKQSFTFGVTVYNLLNERYRDYMNRFRYFNDEVGRNIHVRLTYKF